MGATAMRYKRLFEANKVGAEGIARAAAKGLITSAEAARITEAG